jgi:uronate dehydrogenase
MTRILMTGAAGGLGTAMRQELQGWVDTLRLSDIADMGQPAEGEEIVPCDLADLDAVKKLVEGVDGIIHFGGISIEDTFENILNANFRGTYHIYEAARKMGCSRIIFASSNHAIGFHKRDTLLDDKSPQRPDSIYGLSKCYGENLAQYYHDKFGVETISIRIGSSFPEPKDRRMLSTWLSFRDLANLIKAVFAAPYVGCNIVYGASNNPSGWWDNSHAAFLGWNPQDSSKQFKEKILAKTEQQRADDPAVIYQGGGFAAKGHFED